MENQSAREIFKAYVQAFLLADNSVATEQAGNAETTMQAILQQGYAGSVYTRHTNLLETDPAYRKEFKKYASVVNSKFFNWPFHVQSQASGAFQLKVLFSFAAEEILDPVQSAVIKYRENKMARWYSDELPPPAPSP